MRVRARVIPPLIISFELSRVGMLKVEFDEGWACLGKVEAALDWGSKLGLAQSRHCDSG